VHALEKLVGEQSGIQEELVRIWESSERMEDVLQDLVDQTKASWMQWNDLCRVNIPYGSGKWENWRGRKRWRVCRGGTRGDWGPGVGKRSWKGIQKWM